MKPRRSPVAVHLPPHGVYVWETQHDHGFRMEPESHAFAEVFYVLDGAGATLVDCAKVARSAHRVDPNRQDSLLNERLECR